MTSKIQSKIQSWKVVIEADLDNAELRDFTYAGPSYGGGDAAWVLCTIEQLVEELKEKDGVSGDYRALIDELLALPDGTLIALDG